MQIDLHLLVMKKLKLRIRAERVFDIVERGRDGAARKPREIGTDPAARARSAHR